jgi:putative transcriptional regulator
LKTIRELRTARGWTQLQLANQLGVTPATIHMWERGKSEPTVSALRRLARLFEVSMDDIDLGDEGNAAA